MAKKIPTDDGDQIQLIEVDHPATKDLKRLAGAYQRKQDARKAAKEEEVLAKDKLIEKVREVGTPDAKGNIRVSFNGVTISIEPDEKVKVKLDSEDDDDANEQPTMEGAEPALGARGRR